MSASQTDHIFLRAQTAAGTPCRPDRPILIGSSSLRGLSVHGTRPAGRLPGCLPGWPVYPGQTILSNAFFIGDALPRVDFANFSSPAGTASFNRCERVMHYSAPRKLCVWCLRIVVVGPHLFIGDVCQYWTLPFSEVIERRKAGKAGSLVGLGPGTALGRQGRPSRPVKH